MKKDLIILLLSFCIGCLLWNWVNMNFSEREDSTNQTSTEVSIDSVFHHFDDEFKRNAFSINIGRYPAEQNSALMQIKNSIYSVMENAQIDY